MDGVKLESSGAVVPCARCGQKNRLRFDALDKRTRCGKCGADLHAPGVPVDVPSADVFAAVIRDSALPVLVDFWAEWCGPCRMVAPELAKVASSRAGEFLIVKVDTEALVDVAARFGIQSIPTMALFHRGRELARASGARPAAAIEGFVEQTIAQHAR